ncbi:MAG: 5'/3'-nucleotidase SurE [Paracoccaceae bacterium]|nr:5'/3'-nucleotidase SurE [Paracoccaceae bacterium]
MRILVTNDDGITAPGLALAEEIAAELAGPDGEVWVVAPDFERSGVSHAISYTAPMRTTQLGPRRYTVDGFPADCVLVGVNSIMKDNPPDLVLSGINRGHNVAEDVVYSGTAGAAMEGGLNGIPSIALSQFYTVSEDAPADIWDPARAFALQSIRAVLKMPFTERAFYSINFPAVQPEAVKGTTVCPQGIRADATFEVVPYRAPNGRDFLFTRHKIANQSAPEGTDARLCLDGWVTITPLRPQLTAEDLMDEARAALDESLC